MFSQVWRGLWKGDSVAVKVFNSFDEDSWQTERSIYDTDLLRDANILRVYAAAVVTSRCSQLKSIHD